MAEDNDKDKKVVKLGIVPKSEIKKQQATRETARETLERVIKAIDNGDVNPLNIIILHDSEGYYYNGFYTNEVPIENSHTVISLAREHIIRIMTGQE